MVRVMVFSATFNDSSVTPVYDGGQSCWWRNSEYPEKITDLLHEKTLSHNIVSGTHRHEWDSNSQL